MRPFGTQIVDRTHGVPQFGEPLLTVLTRQSDGPAQGVGTGTGHARVDEGVEYFPLGLTQPRHHGNSQVREQNSSVAEGDTPRDLPSVAGLGLVGDPHSVAAGGFAEPGDASVGGGIGLVLGWGQCADDDDLLTVDVDVGGSGEPVVG